MEIECIHYGDSNFHRDWFKPVKNRTCFNKPEGGMWCSPVNAEWGWKEWCKAEDFYVESLQAWFIFTLKSDKVLVVNSPGDLNKFIWTFDPKYGERHQFPHFEEMSKKWDAIFLTDEGLRSTKFSRPYDLYGWDCESIVILNPECVTNVKPFEKGE